MSNPKTKLTKQDLIDCMFNIAYDEADPTSFDDFELVFNAYLDMIKSPPKNVRKKQK